MLSSGAVPLRLILLDDHVAARQALVRRLAAEPRLVVAGATADVAEAAALAEAHDPHAILIDPRRQDGGGIAAIASLAAVRVAHPPLIAAHAAYYDAEQWIQAKAAGAHDWILNQFDVEALLHRLVSGLERRRLDR
jgi:DNA-binding NarL/FixJ family response regulator